MSVVLYAPCISAQENAVSAFLRLEKECNVFAYYRRIRVPAVTLTARFFVLKLIYELSLLRDNASKIADLNAALWCASEVLSGLDKILSYKGCYSPAVENYLTYIEELLGDMREDMKSLIDIYPGNVKPTYHTLLVNQQSAH